MYEKKFFARPTWLDHVCVGLTEGKRPIWGNFVRIHFFEAQPPHAPTPVRRTEVDGFGGNFGRSAGWDWGQGGWDWVFEVSFGVLTHTATIAA